MLPPKYDQLTYRIQPPDLGAIDCSVEPDTARQEFKDEADINVLLRKFGVRVLERSTMPYFTEIDFTVDLQGALMAREEMLDVYRTLSPELKNLYPTWTDMLNAVEKGELIIKNENAPEPIPLP